VALDLTAPDGLVLRVAGLTPARAGEMALQADVAFLPAPLPAEGVVSAADTLHGQEAARTTKTLLIMCSITAVVVFFGGIALHSASRPPQLLQYGNGRGRL
jgi:hypothetical protein